MKGTILILFMSWAVYCAGQNRTTKEGLKVGYWQEQYESDMGVMKESGMYKIIPLNTYDTLTNMGEGCYEVKYKGATPLLFYVGRHGNKLAVKDGIWQTTKANGSLYRTDYWVSGLNLWTKYVDDKGALLLYDYLDAVNDTSFYLTYKDQQLYKKAFYPPGQKNEATVIFYPDRDLMISEAEPAFNATFGDTTRHVFPLKVCGKKNLTLLSVRSGSDNIQVDFPAQAFPYALAANDTLTVNLIFTPHPSSLVTADTVTILTSEAQALPYRIYCSLNASHINGSNVETLTQMTLSKTKDRYLLIAPMGTSTAARLTNSKGESKNYRIVNGTKINLMEFEVGEYELDISSCDTGGNMTLHLVE